MYADIKKLDQLFFGQMKLEQLRSERNRKTRFGLANSKCKIRRVVQNDLPDDIACLNDPVQIAMNRELIRLVQAEIENQIPDTNDRAMVSARLFGEVSYEKLSVASDQPSATIRSKVCRFRKGIKERFDGEF